MAVGKREYSEQELLRLGRSMRRTSRTMLDLLRMMDLHEEDIKIRRKKRRPRERSAQEKTE